MALVVWIVQTKLTELQGLIQMWVEWKSCSRELESLVGKLGHATWAVPPGWTFMHCMFELLARMRQAHHISNSIQYSTLSVVGNIPGDMEWHHKDADCYPGVAGSLCVDRCFWLLQMQGGVPSFSVLAATAVASTSHSGEYPSSGASAHHPPLRPVGPRLAGFLSGSTLQYHGGS